MYIDQARFNLITDRCLLAQHTKARKMCAKINDLMKLAWFFIQHCDASPKLVCVTEQHYVSIFFTRLWSVRKPLPFDTQNPEISGFSTAHGYKYKTKRQANMKRNVVLFCYADKPKAWGWISCYCFLFSFHSIRLIPKILGANHQSDRANFVIF